MQQPAVVIGIHGLANKPPREEKQRWWKAAIDEGLRRNCSVEQPDVPLDFVYWADLKYGAPLEGDQNLEPYYPDDSEGPFPALDPAIAERERRKLFDRLYRGIEWIEETTRLALLDNALIEYRFGDLRDYLRDPDFRAQTRSRMRVAIERHEGSCMLVAAHSMGALIAYDVLRMMEREGACLRVDHFVTLGAPMGLAEVRLRMRDEHGDLKAPDCVRRWSNHMDRSDAATFGHPIASSYAPNACGARAVDQVVVNAYRRPRGDRNHHKSYGYLRTPEFSHAVREFLEADHAPAQTGTVAKAAE